MWHGVIGCRPEKQWEDNFRTTEVERMAPGNSWSGTALNTNFIATQCERLQGKCQAHYFTCLRPAGFRKKTHSNFIEVQLCTKKVAIVGNRERYKHARKKTLMALYQSTKRNRNENLVKNDSRWFTAPFFKSQQIRASRAFLPLGFTITSYLGFSTGLFSLTANIIDKPCSHTKVNHVH